MPETESAADPDFPIRITVRARKKLYWFVVGDENHWGPGVRFNRSESSGESHHDFGEVDSLDKEAYLFSKFGRVRVAAAKEDAEFFRGEVFDCRSFPPGPTTFFFIGCTQPESRSAAKIRMSVEKLQGIHPDLFQQAGFLAKVATTVLSVTSMFRTGTTNQGWIGRLIGHDDPDGQAEAIEEVARMLWYRDAEPAVVLSTAPFIVGAYSSPMDGVMLLRLPQYMEDQGPPGRTWSVGDRMISCNGYNRFKEPPDDVPIGPRAVGGWNDCWCVLADPISDDHARLDQLKAQIGVELWDRCRSLGRARLDAGHPCRDGRPWYSRVLLRDQKKAVWKPVQRYLN